MSLQEEAELPFDFSTPLVIYPGDIPSVILRRAAMFRQDGCPEQEAVVCALQDFGKELGSIAANTERPHIVA